MNNPNLNGWLKTSVLMFVLWSVMHLFVGIAGTQSYISSGANGIMAFFGSALVVKNQLGPVSELAGHVALDDAINILGYGVLGIMASLMMWRGQRIGLWLNIILLGICDFAFAITMLGHGDIAPIDGIWGPVLYVIGSVTGLLAFYRTPK